MRIGELAWATMEPEEDNIELSFFCWGGRTTLWERH
ncbi:hypothetical protein MHI37_16410 [Paenibacillus sp. FSL H8-0548]